MDEISLLSVVALNEDVASHHLVRGQVGTIVEHLKPGVYEVEFSDDNGHIYASVALRLEQLIVLHHKMVKAA